MSEQTPHVRVIGRYALYGDIASGGMATVHFGRLLGPAGFARTVAIKRLHAQYAKDPEFVSMFLDEARLAARIRHPNVVPTLDVVATEGELFLVMDYVQGESLARLIRTMRETNQLVPIRIAASILSGALQGLHAAHDARNERGEPLDLVHRDVSPQNILVGVDGVPRVLDFGVAKATGRIQTTREGQLKGKLAYMAPEQISGVVTRRTDVYAAGVVLWETLAAQRLFGGENEGQILQKVLTGEIVPPSKVDPRIPADLDAIVLRALERDPAKRFASAREMAVAIDRAVGVASATETGEWVEHAAHQTLALRANRIAEIESTSDTSANPNELLGTKVTPAPVPPSSSSSSPSSAALSEPHSQSSQLSSVSVSHDRIFPRKRTPLWIPIASGLAVAALGFVVIRSLVHPAPSAAPPARVDNETPLSPVAASETPHQDSHQESPATATPATPPHSAPPTIAIAASTTTPQKQRPPTTPPRTGAPPPPPPPPPPPASTTVAPSNCTPPYTLDAQGHKMWKKECL